MENDETPKDEEKKEDEVKDEGKEAPSPASLIDNANVAVDRMKEQNDRREALINREEALMVQRKLGGKADAGSAPVEKKKEETPKEYMERIMKNEEPAS